MKDVFHLLFVILIVTTSSLAIMAQDAVSPSKRKLIAEFMAVSKTNEQMDRILDAVLTTQDMAYASTVTSFVERRNDLTSQEKADLKLSMIEKSKAFSVKFRERMPGVIDFPTYVEQTLYPIYDRAFTEKELADLVAFYKSETGQKVLTVMPQLTTESVEAAQRILIPKLSKLVDDIIAEEVDGLKPPRRAKKN